MERSVSHGSDADGGDGSSRSSTSRRSTRQCRTRSGSTSGGLGDFQEGEEFRLALEASISVGTGTTSSSRVESPWVQQVAPPPLPLAATAAAITVPLRQSSGRRSTSDNRSPPSVVSGIALPASVMVDDLTIHLVRGTSGPQHEQLTGFTHEQYPIYLVRLLLIFLGGFDGALAILRWVPRTL
jgi:hypothetical protein